jgi:hypothetical protein
MAILEQLKKFVAKIKFNINIGNNIGNSSISNNSGNTVVFNIQAPPTEKQLEEEFLKLEIGDFQDITDEVDKSLREKDNFIWCYLKNYQLQLKQEIVSKDFKEPWIPEVPADLPAREEKIHWKFTLIYQNMVFHISYSFIEMDGGHYLIPLPKTEWNKTEDGKINRNSPKRYTITKVQYQLGKALSSENYDYDAMLQRCKIEVTESPSKKVSCDVERQKNEDNTL